MRYLRMVARLDRKRLGEELFPTKRNSIRGVFDKQIRRKPLVFAADAVGLWGLMGRFEDCSPVGMQKKSSK